MHHIYSQKNSYDAFYYKDIYLVYRIFFLFLGTELNCSKVLSVLILYVTINRQIQAKFCIVIYFDI